MVSCSRSRHHIEYSLHGGHGLHGMSSRNGARCSLREPVVQHLAGLDQLDDCCGDVFDRHRRVDAVLVVEIDVVGA